MMVPYMCVRACARAHVGGGGGQDEQKKIGPGLE